jgi:hypothetical protein
MVSFEWLLCGRDLHRMPENTLMLAPGSSPIAGSQMPALSKIIVSPTLELKSYD